MPITPLLVAIMMQTSPAVERKFAYNVLLSDSPIGTAEYTLRSLENGQRQVISTMVLKSLGKEARVRQETIYASDGSATRKIQETVQGTDRKLIVAELSSTAAKIEATGSKTPVPKSVPISDRAPQSNASIFWFDTIKPKKGDRASAYVFDLNDFQWMLETSTYNGPVSIKLAGKSVAGHEIVIERGGGSARTVVDDKGAPLVIERGDMRIVRK